MQLKISDELRDKLRVVRESQLAQLRKGMEDDPHQLLRDCFEEQASVEGVFLYGTIGAMVYLTLDARILLAIESARPGMSHPPRETSNIAWIALGISTLSLCYNLPEMLDLLPARPSNVAPCPHCQGTRFAIDQRMGSSSFGEKQACRRCYGLGWGEPILGDE